MLRRSQSILAASLATATVLGIVIYGRTAASAAAFLTNPSSASTTPTSADYDLGASASQSSDAGSRTLNLSASGTGEVTFSEDTVVGPTSSFGGVVSAMPKTLSFTYTKGGSISDPLKPGDETMSKTVATSRIPFQRFDLDADIGADRVEEVSLTWSGVADPNRVVRLAAWNVQTASWETVATSRGVTEAQLRLTGSAKAGFLSNGRIHVLVTGEDPFADDLTKQVDNSLTESSEIDFTIAHFSDTQYLTEGAVERKSATERAVWNNAYAAIPRWIVANAEKRKIAYTVHTGDLIEDWMNAAYPAESAAKANARRQFKVASANQRILDDAGLVNAVLPGNHDNRTGTETGSNSLFNRYFSPARYQALASGSQWQAEDASYHPWKAGDNSNHYDLFTAGGLDFVAVHLGYGVVPDEISWANSVLERYADRNALLFTHAFNKASYAPDGRLGDYSNDGVRLEEGVVATHPNVALVVSGHEHGVSIAVKKNLGRAGNHVTELLADYQFYEVKAGKVGLSGVGGHSASDKLRFGASFLQLLQFNLARSELSIDTFSPLLNDYNASEYDNQHRYSGREDDTRVPVQLSTRKTSFSTDALVLTRPGGTLIGRAQAASGAPAQLAWHGLVPGEVRAWRATSASTPTQYGLLTVGAGKDNSAPKISAPPTSLILGDAFDARIGVTYTDQSPTQLTIFGGLATSQVGNAELVYLATDSAGNQSTTIRGVSVTKPETTEAPDKSYPQVSVLLASTRRGLATTAYVTVKANHQLVSGGQVTLYLDRRRFITIALKEGRTRVRLPAYLAVGSHLLQTNYSGDDVTKATQIESTFTVAS